MTSRDLVLPAQDRNVPTAIVFEPPHTRSLDQQLADTSTALDYYGHMVVLVPTSLPDAGRRRLHMIRSILECDRIALVRTDLPPLGTALLTQQLRQLSATDLSPGVVAGAARLLAYYIHAGALLNSVARLDRVAVDLKSHLRSWVPGSQFAVTANPEPHLVEAGPDVKLPGPGYRTHLAVSEHGLPADWVREDLVLQWRPGHVHDVRIPADSPAWWGSQKLVEFAAYIPDARVLYQLVTSVRKDGCGWCGREAIGDQCLFCSAPIGNQAPDPYVRHQQQGASERSG